MIASRSTSLALLLTCACASAEPERCEPGSAPTVAAPELEPNDAIATPYVVLELLDAIEANRAELAVVLGEVEDALVGKDGDAAAAAFARVEPTWIELDPLFQRAPQLDARVGRDLFELAWLSHRLQFELTVLKTWVAMNEPILAGRAAGPSEFAVLQGPEGAVLTEYLGAICDKVPTSIPPEFDASKLRRCEGDEAFSKATAYMVRAEIGGPASVVSAKQADLLIPTGSMYIYAIGATPDANAKAFFDISMGTTRADIERMVKLIAQIRDASIH